MDAKVDAVFVKGMSICDEVLAFLFVKFLDVQSLFGSSVSVLNLFLVLRGSLSSVSGLWRESFFGMFIWGWIRLLFEYVIGVVGLISVSRIRALMVLRVVRS